MSRRALKVFMAAALLVGALGAGASPASAVWTTNGNHTGATFSGQAAGGTLLTVAATGAAAQGISCTGATFHGVLTGGPLTTILLNDPIAHIFLYFSGCKVVGQNSAVKCAQAKLTGSAFNFATSTVSGSVSGISCVMTKSACGNSTTVTGGITITGSVNGSYGDTSQALIVNTAGQNLPTSWSGAGCLSGTSPGSGKLSNTSGTALTATITSTFKPQVNSMG